jgi:hypothetical protein
MIVLEDVEKRLFEQRRKRKFTATWAAEEGECPNTVIELMRQRPDKMTQRQAMARWQN